MKFYHIQDDYIIFLRQYESKVAENLRNLILDDESNLSEHDKIIRQRCCNLKVLEEKFRDYKK